MAAVAEECLKCMNGRPVLVGTTVENQNISALLNQRDSYNLLNADQRTWAGVGVCSSRTEGCVDATNMAGRGQTLFWVEMPNTWRG